MIICLANRSIHQHPDIDVAVTHDEDWMEVTKNILPNQWPDGDTLTLMVLDLYDKKSAQSIADGGQPLFKKVAPLKSRPHITKFSSITIDAMKHASRHLASRVRAPYATQACDVCRRK